MTEVNAYIFAFMDFQKHGKREENNLLRILTQEEIKEAQRCLELTLKKQEQQLLDEGFASEMYEYMKLFSNTEHKKYNITERTIRIYDVDRDEFIEEEFDKILKEVTIFVDKIKK